MIGKLNFNVLNKKTLSLNSVFCIWKQEFYLTLVNPMFSGAWSTIGNFSIFTELLSNPKALSSDKLSFLIKKYEFITNFSCHNKSLSFDRNFSDNTNIHQKTNFVKMSKLNYPPNRSRWRRRHHCQRLKNIACRFVPSGKESIWEWI